MADVFIYILYTAFITLEVCVMILMASSFGCLLVLGFYKEDYLNILKCVSFWSLVGMKDPVIRFNYTSWVAAVILTDLPKSVRNCRVIEVFCVVVVLSLCFFEFYVGVRNIFIGLSQISSFFFRY